MNVAISDSVAEEVMMKLALEKEGTTFGDFDDPRVVVVVVVVVIVGVSSPLVIPFPYLSRPRSSVLSSRIPATFRISLPISSCSASTVERCSGGYSRSRNPVSVCTAMYVSRNGMIDVARRRGSEEVSPGGVWSGKGWAAKARWALTMRYLNHSVNSGSTSEILYS